MKTMLKSAAMAAGVLFASQTLAAETLTVANWLPPSHPLVANVVAPYVAAIEKATNGSVTAKILPAPLGPPAAQYDLAVNGVADITFGVQGYTPGRFKTSNVVELPFTGDKAEFISVAYWRTWEKLLKKAGEYDDVKVLAVFSHGPGQTFMKGGDLSKLSTLKGSKIRVGGGIVHEIASALGAVPVEAPSSQSYEILSQGVADGIMFPFESVNFFGLTDLVDQALIVPRGLYNTSFFMVMNKKKWESLSPEDQKAIDSISGEALARMAGKAWDAADKVAFDAMQGKVTFHTATYDQINTITEMVQPVSKAKLAEVDSTGVSSTDASIMMERELEAQQDQ